MFCSRGEKILREELFNSRHEVKCAGGFTVMSADGPTESDVGLDVDKLVANAISSLSLEERQRHLNDQHGVPDQINETPELVTQKLNELQNELIKQVATRMGGPFLWSSAPSPPGIVIAQGRDPNFVKNTCQLRLRVLRAEYYDVTKAATRMISHFDLKMEVFGSDKFCKRITYEDLNLDDVEALKKGFFQYLQARDMSGRRIFVFFPSHIELKDPKTLARLFFYYDAFVDQNKHDKGYIIVSFRLGRPTTDRFDYQTITMLRESFLAYPDSPSAFHACYDPDNAMNKLIVLLLPQHLRAKIKIHVGSPTMWLYDLMSYGISQEVVPLTHNGEMKVKYHHAFIDYRQRLEDVFALGDPCFSPIEVPNNEDVLLGRGRPIQNHKGNVRLRFLVAVNGPFYDCCADREERSKVIENVINQVKSSGGRFLSQEHHVLWMEVDDLTAKEKLSQMFRNFRKRSQTVSPRSPPSPGRIHRPQVSLSSSSDTGGGGGCGTNKQKHDDEDEKGTVPVDQDNMHSNANESRKRPCCRTFNQRKNQKKED